MTARDFLCCECAKAARRLPMAIRDPKSASHVGVTGFVIPKDAEITVGQSRDQQEQRVFMHLSRKRSVLRSESYLLIGLMGDSISISKRNLSGGSAPRRNDRISGPGAVGPARQLGRFRGVVYSLAVDADRSRRADWDAPQRPTLL